MLEEKVQSFNQLFCGKVVNSKSSKGRVDSPPAHFDCSSYFKDVEQAAVVFSQKVFSFIQVICYGSNSVSDARPKLKFVRYPSPTCRKMSIFHS